MKDTIYIEGLLVRTILGVSDRERKQRRDVLVDLELKTDFAKPSYSDDIEDAVNYHCVCERVIELIEQTHCHLLEKLAVLIADMILEEFLVNCVKVKVVKPKAVRFAKSVAVALERSR